MIHRSVRSLAALIASLSMFAACMSPSASAGAPGATPVPSVSVASAADCPTAQPAALPAGETRTVAIDTELGSMTVKVEADLSPIAAGNFVALAGCGYYDGAVFHRVVPGFVIQGGDRIGGTGPGYTIKDEPVTAQYVRGVVAMARTSQPDSVGAQFFIVLDDAAREALASYNTYQIIGHVTAGMETADKITAAAQGAELPSDPVAMTKVTASKP